MNILIFLASLSGLILVHEWGHFWVARKNKVAVEEFGLGFPPRIMAKKFGETIYSFNWIILGGFVKLRGEEDPTDKLGFLAQSAWKKIAITVAGVVMNLVLAYLLVSFGYLIGLPDFDESLSNVTILQVLPNSPAEKNGFKIGDQLLSLQTPDGLVMLKNPKELRSVTEKYKGQDINVLVKRGQQQFSKEVRLEAVTAPTKGPLGIAVGSIALVKQPFPRNFIEGAKRVGIITWRILTSFKDIIVKLVGERKFEADVVGPLGIFNIFEQMKLLGWGYLFHFWALVSLNLVIINILPLPALDGGRIIFNLAELVRGRPLSLKFETIIHQIGFVLLLLLLLLVSLKDLKTILWR